jgi:hypothetical protein
MQQFVCRAVYRLGFASPTGNTSAAPFSGAEHFAISCLNLANLGGNAKSSAKNQYLIVNYI